MANKIYARSPRIVSITTTVGGNSKVELYITNTGVFPGSPTYTLSKPAPSLTNLVTQYNVSGFLREFISMNTISRPFPSSVSVPSDNFCQVRIKTYINNVLSTTTDYDVYDGYGYYTDGGNPVISDVHMTQGSYGYLYGSDPTVESLYIPQWIRIITGVGWELSYTNIRTGVATVVSLPDNSMVIYPCVTSANLADGNYLDVSEALSRKFSGIFMPVTECRYTPSVVEFVNRFGSWQRQHFFKVSDKTINTKKTDYNLYQSSIPAYSTTEGQIRQFNINGKERIVLNSGIVNNDFYNIVKEIVLSERILVNGLPYKVTTESIKKLDENITKVNNYTIEFEPNFNEINNVI